MAVERGPWRTAAVTALAAAVLVILLVIPTKSSYALQAEAVLQSKDPGDPTHVTRKLLVAPVLQELINGGRQRYLSANDEMFRVMRKNKQDIEIAARGNSQIVDVLRDSTEIITNWVTDPIQPAVYPTIEALVAFAFDGPRGCANAGIAWAVGNEFVNGLRRGVPVIAQSTLLPELATHINVSTAVVTVPSDPALDLLDSLPEIVDSLGTLRPPVPKGASLVVVSHPDQAVRAVKLIQAAGYQAYPVDYAAAPWHTYGCDSQGYAHNGGNTTSVPHKLSRPAYIKYEISARFEQYYAGLIDF